MSQTTVTVDREGTVTGNTYDKYGSTNPVVRRLMTDFESTLDELWHKASPSSILDVARPTTASGASGSPATTLAYQSDVNPASSACLA